MGKSFISKVKTEHLYNALSSAVFEKRCAATHQNVKSDILGDFEKRKKRKNVKKRTCIVSKNHLITLHNYRSHQGKYVN